MSVLRLLFITVALGVSAPALAEPKELFWEDLMPKDFTIPDTPVDHNNPMAQQNLDAPIVAELDGQEVKIPGFVVPLEGSETLTTEFLLVPYFGACIHVPPPPPNQIVYVRFEQGVPIDNLYDAVWVSGTLSTTTYSGDLATTGYTMSGIKVEPYDG
ncbi:DUF3299 domain-containing protein [Aestuariibacter salexigens]|uniref:DUF3299 domain-containing protein n=1 Tax=Aestuariibacter salexigens TaxID=226010 RepID=UPI00040A87A4|nr:DUF3299 domain-containing protein [Aestuariibacter salexigens]